MLQLELPINQCGTWHHITISPTNVRLTFWGITISPTQIPKVLVKAYIKLQCHNTTRCYQVVRIPFERTGIQPQCTKHNYAANKTKDLQQLNYKSTIEKSSQIINTMIFGRSGNYLNTSKVKQLRGSQTQEIIYYKRFKVQTQ